MSRVWIRSLLGMLLVSIAGLSCAYQKAPPSPSRGLATTHQKTDTTVTPSGPTPAQGSGEAFALEETTTRSLGVFQGQRLESTPQPSEKLVRHPSYQSPHPLYFTATFGHGEDVQRTLVLDESQGSGKGYDVLYVDADNDEDLREETPVKGNCTKQPGFASGDFPEFSVVLSGDPPLTRNFAASYSHSPDEPARLILHPPLVYQGKVKIGDQERLLAVSDYNGNGLYNDWTTLDPESTGDLLVIDLNGNGKLETRYNDPLREILPYGQYTFFEGQYYQLKVSPVGSSVTVVPCTAPMGQLKIPPGAQRITLASREGSLTLAQLQPSQAVPVGEYRLQTVEYTHSAGGESWNLGACGDGQTQSLVIQEEQTTEFPLGPPLQARIRYVGPAVPGQTVHLEIDLVGKSGELYSAGDITRNGVRGPPPTFRIVDPQGKTVIQGAFEYG